MIDFEESNRTKKNIILCADGTGNKGGSSPDTNVYKIYNAIKINENQSPEQITFYDNGVGTSKNKIWRAVTGAFGIGFRENVCDLYKFLARNYNPGDDVFVFGFSRGAAEARAFSGFVAASGLVDGRELSKDALERRVNQAFEHYKTEPSELAKPTKGSHGAIPIKFIGVWDTVSALGFPRPWEGPGIGMRILNLAFQLLDKITDHGRLAHNFYNYELTDNVTNACHAIAIDDERMSFEPMIWNENAANPATKIEQVWFAGMHSNVGGGYGRAGLANVALGWMMARAERAGIHFKEGAIETVKGSENVHGRLHDSRDGLAVFYRYKPRNIEKLCQDTLQGPIKIHRSALERLERKSGDYGPASIPFEFEIVDSDSDREPELMQAKESKDEWETACSEIKSVIYWRQFIYVLLLEFTLLVLIAGIYFWNKGVEAVPHEGFADQATEHIATGLNYLTPKMFEGLVTFAVINNPVIFLAGIAFILTLEALRKRLRHKGAKARENARHWVVSRYAGSNSKIQ
jgi:uncharacterized protein (DUF2235 family)